MCIDWNRYLFIDTKVVLRMRDIFRVIKMFVYGEHKIWVLCKVGMRVLRIVKICALRGEMKVVCSQDRNFASSYGNGLS